MNVEKEKYIAYIETMKKGTKKAVKKIHKDMEDEAYKKGKEDLKRDVLSILNDISFAITFQTMGQYRGALMKIIKEL